VQVEGGVRGMWCEWEGEWKVVGEGGSKRNKKAGAAWGKKSSEIS